MAPGGSGDPFEGLDTHEREELASLYRQGFTRGNEFMISEPMGQMWLWTSLAEELYRDDRDYFENFWTTCRASGCADPATTLTNRPLHLSRIDIS